MLYPDIKLQKKTQQNSTRYRTALYLRLSREDGDKTESDSIANQRTLLEAYDHYIKDFHAVPIFQPHSGGPKLLMLADEGAQEIFSTYLS